MYQLLSLSISSIPRKHIQSWIHGYVLALRVRINEICSWLNCIVLI